MTSFLLYFVHELVNYEARKCSKNYHKFYSNRKSEILVTFRAPKNYIFLNRPRHWLDFNQHEDAVLKVITRNGRHRTEMRFTFASQFCINMGQLAFF